VVQANPSTVAVGQSFNLTVSVFDQYGNLDTGYTGTTALSSDGSVSLPPNYTFKAADQGVHTFTGLVISTVGTHTIMAFDTTAGFLTGSATVLATQSGVASFRVVAPAAVQSGSAFTVTVTALDAFNNPVPGYTGTVHFSSSDGAATLPADFTFTAADGGIHTFTVILRSIGSQSVSVADTTTPSVVGGTSVTVGAPAPSFIVTGADTGGGPEVKVVDPKTGAIKLDFMAYDIHFLGGVRVALGDVNGDGVPDVITAPGPGGGPDIRVFDGNTGQLIDEFLAYNPFFTGGVFVAAGDFNGDGKADIVTGPDQGGSSDVRVFNAGTGQILREFLAYPSNFVGGARVAVGDVNGDGIPDIITGAGPTGGPNVKVFSGADSSVLQNFLAYGPLFTGGVYVAAGDINGDGKADIITGAGPTGSPNVVVFSGADGSVLDNFLAYSPFFQGGVRVGTLDFNGDGRTDILTGAGPTGGPFVTVFSGVDLSILDGFFAYSQNFHGGVLVGGH
jgi:hypothetical protein